jgi:hypothetical protein
MEILPEAQKQLWPQMAPMADLGFVLYGGTAIALRLGHRTSIDFDFFSDQALDKGMIRQRIMPLQSATVIQDSIETLTVLVPGVEPHRLPVKISFFGNIDIGRVGQPERTDDGVLWLASPEDLLALKLKVILQRIEAKDYLDISALLKSGLSLEYGLAAARALYGTAFQPAESLKALVYFEGGDLTQLALDVQNGLQEAASRVKKLPNVQILSRHLLIDHL